MTELEAMYQEAADLAAIYYWPEYPGLVHKLHAGQIPEGFGKLVGQSVATFTAHGPLNPQTEENMQHGRRLARLRLLLAQIAQYSCTESTEPPPTSRAWPVLVVQAVLYFLMARMANKTSSEAVADFVGSQLCRAFGNNLTVGDVYAMAEAAGYQP
jgi:hypothetical protein